MHSQSLPAGIASVPTPWKLNFFFLEHNVNSLIILTKHPATQEITENWKISGNFVWYSAERKKKSYNDDGKWTTCLEAAQASVIQQEIHAAMDE